MGEGLCQKALGIGGVTSLLRVLHGRPCGHTLRLCTAPHLPWLGQSGRRVA